MISPIDPPTNPFWPGNAGVAPLRTTHSSFAVVALSPGEVVMVMDRVQHRARPGSWPPDRTPNRGRRTRTGRRVSWHAR